mmetsp:Transcript_23652/g.67899  ORF Transcript_23652/g.67899 Transcript_23652/m.67899 type:complete len:200 (-) Transcript_23652:205-804(-)
MHLAQPDRRSQKSRFKHLAEEHCSIPRYTRTVHTKGRDCHREPVRSGVHTNAVDLSLQLTSCPCHRPATSATARRSSSPTASPFFAACRPQAHRGDSTCMPPRSCTTLCGSTRRPCRSLLHVRPSPLWGSPECRSWSLEPPPPSKGAMLAAGRRRPAECVEPAGLRLAACRHPPERRCSTSPPATTRLRTSRSRCTRTR